MEGQGWLLVVLIAAVTIAGATLAGVMARELLNVRLATSAQRRVFAGREERVEPHPVSAMRRVNESGAKVWEQLGWAEHLSWGRAASGLTALIAGLMAGVASLSAAVAVATALSVLAGAAYLASDRQAREAAHLRGQLPALFSGLSASVGAGMSLPQAIARAAETAEEPLASELKVLTGALALGVPLSDALDQFAERSSIAELQAVAVGIGIQHTAGGGLVRILDHATHQLKQGDALRRTIRAHTAQGRMTLGMVTLVPVALAVLLAFISEDYLAVFTGTPLGRVLLAMAITLEVLGAYTVSRLLRVEV